MAAEILPFSLEIAEFIWRALGLSLQLRLGLCFHILSYADGLLDRLVKMLCLLFGCFLYVQGNSAERKQTRRNLGLTLEQESYSFIQKQKSEKKKVLPGNFHLNYSCNYPDF